jgi:hypothetical protein
VNQPGATRLEKLRPDDHFLILLEGDETPMHIGSLLVLDVPTIVATVPPSSCATT